MLMPCLPVLADAAEAAAGAAAAAAFTASFFAVSASCSAALTSSRIDDISSALAFSTFASSASCLDWSDLESFAISSS